MHGKLKALLFVPFFLFIAVAVGAQQPMVQELVNVTGLVPLIGAAFADYGTYYYQNGVWTQITPVAASLLAHGDFNGDGTDDIAGVFAGYGTYTYINGVWTQLTSVEADHIATGDFNDDGKDDILASFSGYGTYTYINNVWTQLTPVEADLIATGDFNGDGKDDIVAAFSGYGTYTYINGTWSQLTSVEAAQIATGDFNADGNDDIVAAFSGYGTYTYISGTWSQLTPVQADFLGVGDFDNDGKDDIVAAFSGYGTYTHIDGVWTQITPVTADLIEIGDFNNDGKDEIVGAFTGYGIYEYMNNSWSYVTGVMPSVFYGRQTVIQGAWEGNVLDVILNPLGVIGITMTITLNGNNPVAISGSIVGWPIQGGIYNPTTRTITAQVGGVLSINGTLSQDETVLNCTWNDSYGHSGTLLANRVNTLPENPDPSVPQYDIANSYPKQGDTGVSIHPTFTFAWSKPMGPPWDFTLYGVGSACSGQIWDGGYGGGYFDLPNHAYNAGTNAWNIYLKSAYSLTPNCEYRLDVDTSASTGFRDPFGVIAASPAPITFTTGGP